MQYLIIKDSDTLSSVSKIVGEQNIDSLLSENGLVRSPSIGKQWREKCQELIESVKDEHGQVIPITNQRKATLLNSLTGSEELFEKACLMDENEWNVFSAFQSFIDTLKIPETVTLPFSERVIGDSLNTLTYLSTGSASSGASSGRSTLNKYGNKDNISSASIQNGQLPTGSGLPGTQYITNGLNASKYSDTIGSYSGNNAQASVTGLSNNTRAQSTPVVGSMYKSVMTALKSYEDVDLPALLQKINSSPAMGKVHENDSTFNSNTMVSWNLPWGKIQLYSSLLDELVDIPAYPEELDEGRTATYTTMPELIYQYEPWVLFQSSGPREQSLVFHLHRDMWSGDHRDNKAIELIRFCQANTFPRYSGSAVLAPTFKVYIDGKTFISGVLTQTNTHWKGPMGLDDWYLEFELSLTIQEVSETVLNIDTVRNFGLVGG